MKPEIKTIPKVKTPNKIFSSEKQNSFININTDSDNYDNLNNYNNLILKSLKDDEENIFQENSTLLFENIITILENLSFVLKDEKKLLYNILKEINKEINLLINEFTSNSKKKIILNKTYNTKNNFFITEEKNYKNNIEQNIDNKNINKENKFNDKLDTNSKVVFLLKIETLNRRIASLNDEIKTMKLIFNNSNDKLNQNKIDNFYKFFMKKIKDIKMRTKCDEFKYLFYIENQQKKIMDLEEQLKIKKNKNLPIDVLKSIKCFPNLVKYNFKEDINPKTIPLHEFLRSYKSPKPKSGKIFKSMSVKNTHQKQLIDSTINNSDRKINNNNEIIINDKIKTEINNNNKKNKNNPTININDLNNNFSFKRNRNRNKNKNNYNDLNTLSFEKLYDSDYVKKAYKTINSDEKILINDNTKKYIMIKNLSQKVKDFHPQTILSNKKEFFLSHPTLNIAGITKGKEAYIGLPKKLLKLNKGGNFKSTMVFPSSLNETMVNLSKLRNKNI